MAVKASIAKLLKHLRVVNPERSILKQRLAYLQQAYPCGYQSHEEAGRQKTYSRVMAERSAADLLKTVEAFELLLDLRERTWGGLGDLQFFKAEERRWDYPMSCGYVLSHAYPGPVAATRPRSRWKTRLLGDCEIGTHTLDLSIYVTAGTRYSQDDDGPLLLHLERNGPRDIRKQVIEAKDFIWEAKRKRDLIPYEPHLYDYLVPRLMAALAGERQTLREHRWTPAALQAQGEQDIRERIPWYRRVAFRDTRRPAPKGGRRQPQTA